MIPISILFLVSYIFDNDTSTKSVQFRDFFLVPVRHTLPLTPPQLSNEGRTLLDIGNCNIVIGCMLRPWDGSLLSAVFLNTTKGICTFCSSVTSTQLRLKFWILFMISLTRFSTGWYNEVPRTLGSISMTGGTKLNKNNAKQEEFKCQTIVFAVTEKNLI